MSLHHCLIFFCQFAHSLYHVLYLNCWAVLHTLLLASGALTCSQLFILMLISTHGWNMDIYSTTWIRSIKFSGNVTIITLFPTYSYQMQILRHFLKYHRCSPEAITKAGVLIILLLRYLIWPNYKAATHASIAAVVCPQ